MRSKEYSHFILTRYNTQLMPDGMLYDNPEKAEDWMSKRMDLFMETKRSILSQSGEFTWVISLDERTPERYVRVICDDPRIKRITCDIRDTFKVIKADTPWVITSRMDCDDQYLPNFVKRVQDHFTPQTQVIDVRFLEMDWDQRNIHEGERRWAGSMFISLIEPKEWITTAFCRPHGQVASGYPTRGTWDKGWNRETIIPYNIIDQQLAIMVCHGNNIANRIRGKFLYHL